MYRRLRYYLRYTTAFIRKHHLPIIVGGLVAILSFFFVPRFLLMLPQFRTTRHVGIIGRHTLSDLPLSIQNQISIGLTVIGPDLKPGPGLAESWEVSEDGKTVTFNLNPNLSWQDGSRINSRDIHYQFRDAVIEYPTDSQIVFKLQDPYSPLPSLVSRPVFKTIPVPLRNPKIIGIATYAIKSYSQNGQVLDRLTLAPVRSDNRLPNITYNFYATSHQARTAFKLGAVSEIPNLIDPQDLVGWPNSELISQSQKDRYVAVLFNTDDPYFQGTDGKVLRLALTYATTKTEPDRAIGPIPDTSWVFNPEVKKYQRDLKRAQDLLSNVPNLPEKLTLSTLPAYIQIAESIERDWEDLGIQVDVISQPDLVSDFQATLIAQAIPPDPDQYIFWHSTQEATNLTRLQNPRIDKLLEDGRKTWDPVARKKIYADFQRYLVEENPAIFLLHPTSYTIIRK